MTGSHRSAYQLLLTIPSLRRAGKCDHAFSVGAPKLWDGLHFSFEDSASIVVLQANSKLIYSL